MSTEERFASFDAETQERCGWVAARILDHVMTAVLLDDWQDPYLPHTQSDEVSFEGTFADQRDVWPGLEPGWRPLSREEFQVAWNMAGQTMVSG